jgi:hypothetical protein
MFENSPELELHPLYVRMIIIDNVFVRNPSYAEWR